MTDPLKPDDLALSELRGRITLPDPVTGAPVRYVWQKTGRQFANQSTDQHPQLQLRVEPGGKKGDTPKQNAMRASMAAVVSPIWRMPSAMPTQLRQYRRQRLSKSLSSVRPEITPMVRV